MQRITSGSAALLLLLVCCSPGVRSVKYTGNEWVKEHQPWSITCKVPKNSVITWTKDDRSLASDDFATGSMRVEPTREEGDVKISTLKSDALVEKHVGAYKCVEGEETHLLNIIHEVTTKVIFKNETITLDCPEAMEKPVWTKGNTTLTAKSPYYSVNDEGQLSITYPDSAAPKDVEHIYSTYSCGVDKLNMTKYRVLKRPHATVPDTTIVIEGEKLHLTCSLKLEEPGLKIMWSFKGKNYTNSDLPNRIKLTNDEEKNIPNAIFHLDDVEMSDRGNITCIAYYNHLDTFDPEHVGIATSYLRVKDKLAALWPFLGIVAEVVVLCAIILIYEKKRNKSELEESDTDQSPDTKPTPNKDSDVRHRK